MAADTLKRIDYSTLEQLIIDINRNFAVVQNSPLYKGLPGKGGNPGNVGTKGIRGTNFLFVNLAAFKAQFPGELQISLDINLAFLNSKVSDFNLIPKLFLALNTVTLVDKDIVVLTNSMMLSYDALNIRFVDTGMAFNENTSLGSTIDTQIGQLVTEAVNTNPTINNIDNIFQTFNTYARNFASVSMPDTTPTGTSIYMPYLPNTENVIDGNSNSAGTLVSTHKYFGFSYFNNKVKLNNSETFVLGSMEQYFTLLKNTIGVTSQGTYSSQYAPGANNMPNLVLLQETDNAGILFGRRSNTNLSKFASIYKNIDKSLDTNNNNPSLWFENVVIQSSQPTQDAPAGYSKLQISDARMKYDKAVEFGADFKFLGDLASEYFNFTKSSNQISIGKSDSTTTQLGDLITDKLRNSSSLNKVHISDTNGRLLDTYSLETYLTSNFSGSAGLSLISGAISNDKKIVTSNYLDWTFQKINNILNYISPVDSNSLGYIPRSKFYGAGGYSLSVQLLDLKVGTISQQLNYFEAGSAGVKFPLIQNKVLVTGADGAIGSSYSIEGSYPVLGSGLTTHTITSPEFASDVNNTKRFLTSKHYWDLIVKLDSMNSYLTHSTNGYFSKSDWTTASALYFTKVELTNHTKDLSLSSIDIWSGATNVFKTSVTDVLFPQRLSKVLVTESDGKVSNSYSVETTTHPTMNTGLSQITAPFTGSSTKFLTSDYYTELVGKINLMNSYLTDLSVSNTGYYSKSKLTDASTALTLSGLKVGATPFTIIDISTSAIKLPQYTSGVLVTDNLGVLGTKSIEGGSLVASAGLTTQEDLTIVGTVNKFLTSNYLTPIINKINNIIGALGTTYSAIGHSHVIANITDLTTTLSSYLLKTDIAAWAKSATKPSYVYSEIGGTPPAQDLTPYATKSQLLLSNNSRNLANECGNQFTMPATSGPNGQYTIASNLPVGTYTVSGIFPTNGVFYVATDFLPLYPITGYTAITSTNSIQITTTALKPNIIITSMSGGGRENLSFTISNVMVQAGTVVSDWQPLTNYVRAGLIAGLDPGADGQVSAVTSNFKCTMTYTKINGGAANYKFGFSDMGRYILSYNLGSNTGGSASPASGIAEQTNTSFTIQAWNSGGTDNWFISFTMVYY